jgi:transposase-like protein
VERITARKKGFYRCNPCKKDFTVRTGTIFERSHIPLHKWLCAMYLLVTARKGISSMQLSKELDITQKTAWFFLQRLIVCIVVLQRTFSVRGECSGMLAPHNHLIVS